MTLTQINVGIAEIAVTKEAATLVCLGLGSCIGVCAYDAASKVAGMIHIMLPEQFPGRPLEKPGKFADTGIPELLRLMRASGADPSRLQVAYAGGAQVFKFGADTASKLDVGARNCVAVEQHVKQAGLKPLAIDVGGSSGRTLTFDTTTGEIRSRTIAGGEKILCTFRR